MAPSSLLGAGLNLLAKSFLSSSSSSSLSSVCRWSRVLTTAYISPIKLLSTQTSGPPKRPLNGYMRFVVQQKPAVVRHNPEIKAVDIIRKIAQQWRAMSPEQKQPFKEAFLRAQEQFKVDLQRYQAQLSPAQLQQQTLEKRQKMAKRKAIRKKRELSSLGKPKRPRSPFNIFMSEHFEEARGDSTQAKMKSLLEDYKNLFGHQKKVYVQLAEDDKVRYQTEMASWEEHMVDLGREDLLREHTLSARKKSAARLAEARKGNKKTTSSKVTASKKTKQTRTDTARKPVLKGSKKR